VRHLLFIPTYNEAENAHRLAQQIAENADIAHTIIVDDSDDPANMRHSATIDEPNTTVIRRKRAGKWSAWRIALKEAHGYDALIQSDSDITITHPEALITALKTCDIVTAYQNVKIPTAADPLSRRIGETYRDAHRRLRATRKFNMGGRFMALSRRLSDTLLDAGFFTQPVPADDHVIALTAASLGLRCASVDCGAEFTAPATLDEWVRYRSRHRDAIKWSEKYVTSRIGHAGRVHKVSSADIKLTTSTFLATATRTPDPVRIIALAILGASTILPRDDNAEWKPLTSTKPHR
jgi:glycosyltransferase involved in cell wall biosynthesis